MAGETFVTTHYARIYRLHHYLTGSAEAAQDLTQQTFTQAWQALASYQGRAKLSTWLHRIAYHVYTHWLRDCRNHLPLAAVAEMPDLRAVCGLDSLLVSTALTQLSDELRETFLLYYIQELSVSEVAEVQDLPVGTVKSRLFTARQRLRELLQAVENPLPPSTDKETRLRYSGVGGEKP
jgi:RNA polymerase sigma-70 factor, ECF subfamily